MKAILFALFVGLLMVGCGEEAQKKAVQEEAKDDPSVPLAIPCVACGEKVSKKTTECRQCGHPTPDSVVVYKKAQELARIRVEEERKRREEETNPAASSLDASQTDNEHSLRFAVIAPIKHLIVRNEGGLFPETNQKTREFKDLPAGWEGTLTFRDSFKCYCSSLENLRFFVDDGAEKKIEGEGTGNFTWKPE